VVVVFCADRPGASDSWPRSAGRAGAAPLADLFRSRVLAAILLVVSTHGGMAGKSPELLKLRHWTSEYGGQKFSLTVFADLTVVSKRE